MKVEMLREGYLIKGARSEEEARTALGALHANHVTRYDVGRYRKIPGQWSDFRLHDGSGPGSFEAVIAYIENP